MTLPPCGEGQTAKPKRLMKFFAFAAPAGVALIVAVVVYTSARSNPNGTSTVTLSQGGRVSIGKDYYVSLALIEVEEKKSDGKVWDLVGGEAPDLRYDISWRGTRVFESSTKTDSLIAKWSPAEVNIRDIAMSKSTSADDLMKAARINIRDGETVTFTITDEDLVSADQVGSFELPTSELTIGDKSYDHPSPVVRRVVVRVQLMDDTPPIE